MAAYFLVSRWMLTKEAHAMLNKKTKHEATTSKKPVVRPKKEITSIVFTIAAFLQEFAWEEIKSKLKYSPPG